MKWIVAIGAAIMLLVGCQSPCSAVSFGTNHLLIGDSITKNSPMDGGVEDRWADRSFEGIDFVNNGVGGTTTQDWIDSCWWAGACGWADGVVDEGTDVWIMLGINDIMGGGLLPSEVITNLTILIDKVDTFYSPRSFQIIHSPNVYVGWGLGGNAGILRIDELANLEDALCAADERVFCPVTFQGFGGSSTYDGVHFNVSGHDMAVERMGEVLVPEPSTGLLMASGLATLAILRRRAH